MHSPFRSLRAVLCTLLVTVAVGSTPARAGDLAGDLEDLVRKSGLAQQRVAFSIQDVRGNRTLAAMNGSAPMAPASNLKVLTTGAALATLGPDFTFDTTLFLARTNGTVRLTLVGAGDPALDDPDLRDRDPHGLDFLVNAWSEELRKAGVTRVDELVVDARIFDREFYHPSWPKEQYPNAYCAEIWGFNLGRNLVGITPVPQADGKPSVVLTPDFALPIERNAATCRAKDKFTFTASRGFGTNALTLRGNAARKPESPLALTVHDTPTLTAGLLQRAFAARGIAVASARIAAEGDAAATGTIVPPIHSTPIATVLERANTDSENMYAEALLKRLGAAVANVPVPTTTAASGTAPKAAAPSGAPTAMAVPASRTLPGPAFVAGSWTNGRAALRQSIAQWIGADVLSNWTIDDGCGLSQENRVTADGVSRWLAAFARDPRLAPTYFGSFAIAGKTGTVRKRFDDLEKSAVEVRCKTGYIRGVSCLSGLVIAPDGRSIAFSILGNNLAQGDQVSRAKGLQEAIVRRLVQELAPLPAAHQAARR